MIQMYIKLESLLHIGSLYDATTLSRVTESYVKTLDQVDQGQDDHLMHSYLYLFGQIKN